MLENFPINKFKNICPISGLVFFQSKEWKNVLLSDECTCSYFLIGDRIVVSKPVGFAGLEEVKGSMDYIDKIISEYIKDKPFILMHDYSGVKGFSEEGREYYLKHKQANPNLKGIIFFGISPIVKLGINLGRVKIGDIMIYIVKDYREAINIAVPLVFDLPKNVVNLSKFNKEYLVSTTVSKPNHVVNQNDLVEYLNNIMDIIASIDWTRPGIDDFLIKSVQPPIRSILDALCLIKYDFDQILEEHKRKNLIISEQRKKYQTIVDNVSDLLFIHDLNGKFLEVNAAWKQIGFSEQDLKDMALWDIIPERYHHEISMYLEEIRKKTELQGLMRLKLKNGEERIVEYRNTLVHDIENQRYVVYGSARDITYRIKLEKQLRFNEMLYRGIMEASPDPILLFDSSTSVIYVNPAFCSIMGYGEEEVIGRELFFLDKSTMDHILNLLISHKKVISYDAIGIKRNGEKIYLSVSVSKIDAEGRDNEFVMILRDETEKVLAKQEVELYNERLEEIVQERTYQLRESEERYRTILETIEDGYFEVDLQGNLTFGNDSLFKITGYTREELLGKNNREYSDEKNSKILFKAFNQVYRTGEPIKALEWEMVSKGGKRKYIENSVSLIRDRDGKPIGFRGIVRDITKRKQMEREIIEAKDLAEKANEAKTMFIANMSHEIRTPLNGIIGICEILRDIDLPFDAKMLVENIFSEANMLFSLINNVLDLSKIEAGKIELEEISFDIKELFFNIVKVFSVKARKKGLEFYYDFPQGIHSNLLGDPTRLRQILYNLLENAIKFTPKGRVGIRCEVIKEKDDKINLCFFIEDTGIGIPKDKQNQIFKGFVQADVSTTRKFGGTGLGVTISKELVELMGGELNLESSVGEGSTFWFCLEFKIAKKGNGEVFFKSLECIELRDKTFLIVSDSPQFLRKIQDIVNPFGARYVSSSTDQDLFSILGEEKIDLILLDLRDEETNPFELVKKIQSNKEFSNIPIVGVALVGMIGDGRKCRDAKMSGYISLPVSKREVEIILKGVLSGTTMDNNCKFITKHEIPKKELNLYRILLVEDYEVNKMVVTRHLKKEGFSVDIASNGREAVNMFLKRQYDLILMDIQMPEMDGYEATKEIREIEKKMGRNPVPIIAMTAHAMKTDKERCINSGMNDYISKPIRRRDLIEMVHKWILKETEKKAQQSNKDYPCKQGDPIDLDMALKEFDEDIDFFLDVVKGFIENLEQQLVTIENYLKDSNLESLSKEAHSIKGGAYNLGAKPLGDVASKLEDVAKQGNESLVDQCVKEIWEEFRRLKSFLKEKLTGFDL